MTPPKVDHNYDRIQVNISRDTNERRLIVKENPVQPSTLADARQSRFNIVRVVGEPVLVANRRPAPACSADVNPSNGLIAANVDVITDENETLINDEPPPDNQSHPRRTYETPHFVAHKALQPVAGKPSKAKPTERLGIETIFPNACFHYLNDECVEGDNCFYSHMYPEQQQVSAKLYTIGWQNAAKLFRVILARCHVLLEQYFVVFARFFARQGQRGPLLDMLYVCEDPQNNIVHYMVKLVKAFRITGLDHSQTIVIILKNQRIKTSQSLSILFDLNVPGNNVNELCKALNMLNKDDTYLFDVLTINYLLVMSCMVGKIAFMKTIIAIVKKLNKKRAWSVINSLDANAYQRFLSIYNGMCATGNEMRGLPTIRGRRRQRQ